MARVVHVALTTARVAVLWDYAPSIDDVRTSFDKLAPRAHQIRHVSNARHPCHPLHS